MAVIKVPYTYREFRFSPRATFVDKHTHKPSSCALIAFVTGVAMMLIACLLFNASNSGEGIVGTISYILLLVGFFWFIFGSLIIPKLSDHFDWAGKMAKKDMEKYRYDSRE